MEKVKGLSTYRIALIGVMSAVVCILGPLTVMMPISPVPLSLANLAIFISAFVLGHKMASVSCLIYLLVGLAGVPVFSGFTAGIGKLAGPTGGYLIGYLFLAFTCGWFIDKFWGKLPMYIVGMILGSVVMYLFGTIWLAKVAGYSLYQALWAGVIPFLPGDFLKMAIAVMIGPVLRKRLIRANLFL